MIVDVNDHVWVGGTMTPRDREGCEIVTSEARVGWLMVMSQHYDDVQYGRKEPRIPKDKNKRKGKISSREEFRQRQFLHDQI